VAEFAGTPRAGKTSAMHGLNLRLRAGDHRVHLVEERACISPIPASQHPQFNLWTASTTSALILEAMYSEADVVLVDRGLFDSLCWMDWYRRSGQLTRHDHEAIKRFMCVGPLREIISLVLVMKVDPTVALQRERATWAAGAVKGPGRVMNVGTLTDLNISIAETVDRHRSEFGLHELDTTTMDQAQTVDVVAGAVQELMCASAR